MDTQSHAQSIRQHKAPREFAGNQLHHDLAELRHGLKWSTHTGVSTQLPEHDELYTLKFVRRISSLFAIEYGPPSGKTEHLRLRSWEG